VKRAEEGKSEGEGGRPEPPLVREYLIVGA